MKRLFWVTVLVGALPAFANAPVQRSFVRLPSSNGYTAILADLPAAKLTHFRDHLFATEEPLLDASGAEVWVNGQPQFVASRDLLYDAYFGVRVNGSQRWLTQVPVSLDQSGYADGGTGVVTWLQVEGPLELTTYAFAPRSLPRAGFVFAVRVRNTSASPASGVSVFSLHNFHLGYGRPGVMQELGENGETVTVDAAKGDFLERAFAGVVVTRALSAPSHRAAWNNASASGQNGYFAVANGGTTNLPDAPAGELPVGDGYAHAFQFDLGTLAAGQETWAGVVVAHHGDPFGGATVQAALDAYVAGRNAKALVEAELSEWAAFQARVSVPAGTNADEEKLFRQSAAMIAMAQVQESSTFLRELLSQDGEPRRTRFSGALPGTVSHKGQGAIVASLPPGEWSYAWPRDGAYAVSALSAAGLKDEAKRALSFYLNAEGGRFWQWNELKPYAMPPYLISLTRYHGFGVEETDFNAYGPNLEFDGFGLFLWALRHYERTTQDEQFAQDHWQEISERVADPLVALVDTTTGLIQKDSSIWETHWNGRQRNWTYTNLTAVRGLCDAAEIAERVGDSTRATRYRTTAQNIRRAMERWLVDGNGALVSNLEERISAGGAGDDDAAVVDAIALGLVDPNGRIAQATLTELDLRLRTSAGSGWSRNDDRTDHPGGNDLSPWGSEYDSAEWVVTDLRGAVAMRLSGRTARADDLLGWVLEQSLANNLAVSETFDETTGAWKFNAPMIGFGAGAWMLALAARASDVDGPACGAYLVETGKPDAGASTSLDGGEADAGSGSGGTATGCGCGSAGASLALTSALLLFALARRRRPFAGP